MTITMYDAADPQVVAHVIPSNAQAVAGYVGPTGPINRFVTFPAVVARFSGHAHCFSIATHSFLIASCLDIENGDATPEQAVGWYFMMRAHGQFRPCFYADAATMPSVEAALQKAGIPRKDYRLWIAAFPGTGANVPAGFDGHQYTDHGPHGENYDVSVLLPNFFDGPHKPKPRLPKLPKLPAKAKPHRKVVGATGLAAVGVALTGLLHTLGIVTLTPAESSAVAALLAALGGYATPTKPSAA